MIDVRCKNCNRLLMKADLFVGAVKCPGCRKIFEYRLFGSQFFTNSQDPLETKQKLKETIANK